MLPGKRDDKGQAEFTRTPAQYVNAAYLAKLADQGKALLVKHRDALEKIERELGVQRQFVLAIWGRETAFGAHRSPHYAVQVLATQAYAGRRKDMFRNELIHALKMLEDGILTRETMKSSWAGAMGLTQFMPSEYYAPRLRSRRRRPQGHLELGARCTGLRRQPAPLPRLGGGTIVGLRGAPAARR